MQRYPIIVACGVVSLLFAAVFPVALGAQERGPLTDFRERGAYTTEDLAQSLFATAPLPSGMRERGIGPQQPQKPPSVALNVYFAPNSNRILKDYYADLNKLGEVLSNPQHAGKRIQIEGHTDSVGSDRYNQVLSEKRAQSVKQYLVQHFTIVPQRLVVTGYGEAKPIASNDTEESRKKNRRIEVVSLGQ